MAEVSYPWNTVPVNEAEWREMMEQALLTGIFRGALNELQGYADSTGLQVKVKTGKALIKGHFYKSDAETVLAIGANSSGNPRIDLVVLRANFATRAVNLAVVPGTPAASPVAPALTQTSGVWELAIAEVAVANGAVTIAAGDVTDRRTLVQVDSNSPFTDPTFLSLL